MYSSPHCVVPHFCLTYVLHLSKHLVYFVAEQEYLHILKRKGRLLIGRIGQLFLSRSKFLRRLSCFNAICRQGQESL
jgi:hypothetical protein